MTYTGVPDMHNPSTNGYNNIALGYSESFNNNSKTDDKGWTKPNDQIHSMGLNLNYNLEEDKTFTTAYKKGEWGDFEGVEIFTDTLKKKKTASIFQDGPKLSREVNSTTTERIKGFRSIIHLNAELKKQIQRGEGWAGIQDNKWGISIGIKNFFKEYPKEISFNDLSSEAIAYLWSPKASR